MQLEENQNMENKLNVEEQNNDSSEISMEELLANETALNDKLYMKEIIQVKVVEVTNEYVFVDIGEKKEGIIAISEFEDKKPEVGSNVIAVLERKGGENNNPILSHRKAREKLTLQWLEKAFASKERVRGRVQEQIKGGYIIDISGVRAFMPLSLSEIGGSPKHYLPVNAKVKFYIIDISLKDRKIIVSRRQVLEEDEKIRRQEVLTQTKENQITRVVISKVVDSGIFVRYQGMSGFINLSDVAWKNPAEAIKNYKRGQRLKVKILKVDKENEKITFSIKHTTVNPLDMLKRKFPFRTQLKVKIVEETPEGLKAHISDDIYGFIAQSDYGYEGVPKKDEIVNVVVVGVNPETYELKLSIKRFEELENKKQVQKYLKSAPKLTLGQILENNETEEQ